MFRLWMSEPRENQIVLNTLKPAGYVVIIKKELENKKMKQNCLCLKGQPVSLTYIHTKKKKNYCIIKQPKHQALKRWLI